MNCPNCGQQMNSSVKDRQPILHCSICGGSFFEQNGINRISLETANQLYQDRQNDEVSGTDKYCPKDGTILRSLHHYESIPEHITLLRCAECHGIFAYPEDLVLFKKAQSAKIDYLAAWKIPMPSVKTVAVLGFVAFFSAVLLGNYLYLKPSNKTQAEEMVQRIYLKRSSIYLFLSFTTQQPVSSRVVFEDRTTNETIEKEINDELATFHQITVSDLDLHDEIYYHLVFTNKIGEVTSTKPVKLNVQ